MKDEILFVNAASLNFDNEALNAPIIVDYYLNSLKVEVISKPTSKRRFLTQSTAVEN